MTLRALDEYLRGVETTDTHPFAVGDEVIVQVDMLGTLGRFVVTWPLRVVAVDNAPVNCIIVECVPKNNEVIFFGTTPIEKSRCMRKVDWMFLRRARMYRDVRTKKRSRNESRVRRRERAMQRSILEINATWGM